MYAYVIKRILSGIVVIFLVSVSIFLLFWFGPENPAKPICDRDTSNRCTPAREAIFTKSMGYDNPWYEEYGKFVKGVFVGRTLVIRSNDYECPAPCLGISHRTKRLVYDELIARLPATASVAIGGSLLYLAFGIPIGVAAARRRGTVADKLLVSTFLVMSSVPYYLIALLTWLYFTVAWEIPALSDTGYFPITENPLKFLSGMLLAWLALGMYGSTQYTRYTRGAMVETLGEDYIRTAKAKGLPPRTVVYKHALRAAMVPVVTIFGIDIGILFAGTIFTERIFDIQGIGFWGLTAVYTKDLPVVMATALFTAVMVVISNIVVDLVYSLLDPRVRLG